jgi:protein-S-isoprenylcysteine O-methyltransferase Ste14
MLACLAVLAIGRGVMLSARGIRLFPIDRERSLAQGLADLVFVLCFLCWVYETLAFAVPLAFHLAPVPAREVVVESTSVRAVGALAMAAGLVVYALALQAFGASWRIGIDRDHPGELVTDGIFARSRNPVYLGLILLVVGSSLILGRLVLVLLAGAFLLYFPHLVGREERFLLERHGDAYREYTRRVGRWWTWRRTRGAG